MPRAVMSATIGFGMVSIPTKLYTACSSEQARFSMITPNGNKVKQQYIDTVTGDVVEQKDCLKGFEHTKGQFVTFTVEEIKSLEAERTNLIDIVEFVPASSVDLVAVEKSYYLGPDKGGDKPYLLLSAVMCDKKVFAVGRWSARGKEQLVLIRPYGNGGLILHQLYYSNEVRSFSEIEDSFAKFSLSDREKDMAGALVEQLSAESFDSSQYKDEYVHRINAAVQQKLSGQSITIVAAAPRAPVADLFAALQASVDKAKKGAKAAKSDPKAAKSDPAAAKPTKKKKAS